LCIISSEVLFSFCRYYVFHFKSITYMCRSSKFTCGVYTRFQCCVSSELFVACLERSYKTKEWPPIWSFQIPNLMLCFMQLQFTTSLVFYFCFRWSHCSLIQMEPYLRGDVSPMMDKSSDDIDLDLRISKLRESMCNLHSLQMKLRVQSLLFLFLLEICKMLNSSFIPIF
jgi:hypothetical protein